MAAASQAVPDTSTSPVIDNQLTNRGADMDSPPDDGLRSSPNRHQVPTVPGGVNDNFTVVYCTGVPCSYNYRKILNCFEQFGTILGIESRRSIF